VVQAEEHGVAKLEQWLNEVSEINVSKENDV